MTMQQFNEAAAEFLALKRIAVAGVSRSGKQTGNMIFKALKDRGYEVFILNPNASHIDGVQCYPSVQAIPGGVEGVLIVTRPEVAEQVAMDAADAGVTHIWMHDNTLAPSSVSLKGANYAGGSGAKVIAGGCPMMFLDFGHKCMKWMLGVAGRMPPSLINFSAN